MAIAAAQLAASSATAKFACTPSVAVPRAALPGLSFAPLSARRSAVGGSSRISVRSSNRHGKPLSEYFPDGLIAIAELYCLVSLKPTRAKYVLAHRFQSPSNPHFAFTEKAASRNGEWTSPMPSGFCFSGLETRHENTMPRLFLPSS